MVTLAAAGAVFYDNVRVIRHKEEEISIVHKFLFLEAIGASAYVASQVS